MRALKEGADPRELLRHSLRRRLGICSGLAWAARREVLRDGLYDACIIGSGSRAIRCAQLGFTDEAFRYLDMGRGWRNHYQAWADKHFERVRGSLGSIDGKLTHLWHGSLNKRRYVERHHGLSRFGFDPTVDLELTERGVWRWASDKADMHRYVRDYLYSRDEDDEGASSRRGGGTCTSAS